MRYFYLFVIVLILGCKPSKKEFTTQEIIDASIVNSGTDKVANSKITFKFRDKKYSAKRNKGNFVLTRSFDSITDILSNTGFKRFVNQLEIKVADSMVSRYSNSVNSVHYFSVLPFGLNDTAVFKNRLPSSTIKGKEYYKIEVTFSEKGGGEDFDDVFIYWIGKEDFLVDYLAYSYHTNGGGKRFRVLKEQCSKNGIRFVDYYNFKPLNKSISLLDIDKAFENNQLRKISEIILKDINVDVLD
tara:strand:- start:488 stop:1216 length:729 start_codon:yes stop_codon:yes gene_type:complete